MAPKVILEDIEAHGRVVDALVNNAGYGIASAYADTRWEDQRAFLQVMVTAVCELAHRAVPGMVDAGSCGRHRQRRPRLGGGAGGGKPRRRPL